jgi:hypothetical protein
MYSAETFNAKEVLAERIQISCMNLHPLTCRVKILYMKYLTENPNLIAVNGLLQPTWLFRSN